MSAAQYIVNAFFFAGCAALALTVMVAARWLAVYIFARGDDAERLHAKAKLLKATLTLMFLMLLWSFLSLLGSTVFPGVSASF